MRGQGSRWPTLGPSWTQAPSLMPLRTAPSPLPNSGRAEAQAQLLEPSRGHMLQPLLARDPCYQPPLSQEQLGPHRALHAWVSGVRETEEALESTPWELSWPSEKGQVETQSLAHAHAQRRDRKTSENSTKRWRWASD